MSRKNPESLTPNITDEHRLFGRRASAIAQDMYAQTFDTIYQRFGPLPSAYAREALEDSLCTGIRFGHDGLNIHRSGPLEGSIAGSDFFSLASINVPEDACPGDPEETISHQGRIIALSLYYDSDTSAHGTEFLLYAVTSAPPVMVSKEGIQGYRRYDPELSWDSSSSVGIYMEKLPARHVHFPEASELTAVLNGLRSVYDQIDLSGTLHVCRIRAEHDRRTNPQYEPDRAWFLEQEIKANKMRM